MARVEVGVTKATVAVVEAAVEAARTKVVVTLTFCYQRRQVANAPTSNRETVAATAGAYFKSCRSGGAAGGSATKKMIQ
jgi:hypothetical protein